MGVERDDTMDSRGVIVGRGGGNKTQGMTMVQQRQQKAWEKSYEINKTVNKIEDPAK